MVMKSTENNIEATSKRVEFLYLSQEDCIKAGALDMKGTLAAIQTSFELHGKRKLSSPQSLLFAGVLLKQRRRVVVSCLCLLTSAAT